MKKMLAIFLLLALGFENSSFAIDMPNGEIPMKKCDDPKFNPAGNHCATFHLQLKFRPATLYAESAIRLQCHRRNDFSETAMRAGNAPEVYAWAKTNCGGEIPKVFFSVGFNCEVFTDTLSNEDSDKLAAQTNAKPLILPVRVACGQNKTP